MIIPIDLAPPPHRRPPQLAPVLAKLGSDEVVLIELQGWLDVVEGERQAGFIGTLLMENDKPVLKIGHHHLEGKLVSLSKPLAVLAHASAEDDQMDNTTMTRYDVVTLVKRKILFRNRPVPVVKRA
ncbi:Ctf8-domain-containing protein [Hysterangium stoloniferum]|nr:Ctf8-domain-containing protein [Hysterangium stoloniferum]